MRRRKKIAGETGVQPVHVTAARPRRDATAVKGEQSIILARKKWMHCVKVVRKVHYRVSFVECLGVMARAGLP
jgi:hypothetical protein